MLRYKNLIIMLVISIIIISGFFLMNDVNMLVRMKELKIYLQKTDRDENSINHIGLVAKYKLQKRLYDGGISNDKSDEIEFQIEAMTARVLTYNRVKMKRYKYLSFPAILLINLNRFLIGKSPLKDLKDMDSGTHMDIAYYCERNRYYNKAIERYLKAVDEENLSPGIAAGIFLHVGYCYALLGEYNEARNYYKKVIEEYGQESVAITATILVRYLDGFHIEHRKILEGEIDSITKSEKLFKLLAYEESLGILEKIEYKANPSQLARIRYYKASCLSELGKTEKAVDEYLRIITSNPESKFAKLSTRRVYMIGTRLGGDNEIKEAAVNLNKVLNDRVLKDMIDAQSRLDPQKAPEYHVGEVKIDKSLKKRIDVMASSQNRTMYIGKTIHVTTTGKDVFIGKVLEYTADYISLKSESLDRVIMVEHSRVKTIKILDK